MAGTGTSRRDVRPGDRCRLARPRRPRALLVVVAAVDLFLTVFNYDGFTTLATQFHHVLWKIVRTLGSALPERARHSALSVGAASMLPATVALWLGLEVTGFALMYSPGLARDDFALHDAGTGLGTAFYLSAGAISSLTFGDVTARAGLDRALVDLETILGLATFTLALGYVVTTFGVLGALETCTDACGVTRRTPSGLRRSSRALLRWGLPPDEPMTEDPFLAALLDGYETTIDRLRRSFVGPEPLSVPEPLSRRGSRPERTSGCGRSGA